MSEVFSLAKEATRAGHPIAVHAPGVTSKHDRNKVRDAAAELAAPTQTRVTCLWSTPLFGTPALIATPHDKGVHFEYGIYH